MIPRWNYIQYAGNKRVQLLNLIKKNNGNLCHKRMYLATRYYANCFIVTQPVSVKKARSNKLPYMKEHSFGYFNYKRNTYSPLFHGEFFLKLKTQEAYYINFCKHLFFAKFLYISFIFICFQNAALKTFYFFL